jgi:chemotaxis protein MotB
LVTRKRKPEEHVSHERWLVSYADFITLLFAFFTTMYAISTVDAQKMGRMVMSMRASFENSLFSAGSDRLSLSQGPGSNANAAAGQQVVESLRAAKGPNEAGGALRELKELNASFHSRDGARNPEKLLSSLQRSVESLVGPEALGTKVRTRMDERGLVISLGEGGFFDSGSEILKPGGRVLLDAIASALVITDNHIRVEGHTDNVPIRNTRFPSNWELSTARATTVVAYLIDRFRFAPDRLSAGGYSEYRPVETNMTAEGRSRNRRVDIVVLHPRYAQVEPR